MVSRIEEWAMGMSQICIINGKQKGTQLTGRKRRDKQNIYVYIYNLVILTLSLSFSYLFTN